MLPPSNEMIICFAHSAYNFQARFRERQTGIQHFEVRTREELDARVGEADVLVISGLWHNGVIDLAPRLRFIQSISSGVDRYDLPRLQSLGVRLSNAQGVAARAVSEHAMAMILALLRRLPEARDNQARHNWRNMWGDLAFREDELGGKTLLVIGLGMIGGRLAHLGKAFDMRVVGVRQDPSRGLNNADEVYGLAEVKKLIPQADIVALTCPLTPETTGLLDEAAFASMKPTAYLVNVARGGCVVEQALIQALTVGRIAGAGIDVAEEEPLPDSSPLWDMKNVLITPHTGGDTHRYEDVVLDYLQDNLSRLWRGEARLYNEII